MTAAKYSELRCDALGCARRFSASVVRVDATRVVAARDGWVHGVVPPDPHRGGPARSLDYCADHAAQLGDLCPKTLPEHARVVR